MISIAFTTTDMTVGKDNVSVNAYRLQVCNNFDK